MKQSTIAILGTTYNQPNDLDLYLTSLKHQTDQNFRIYLADDGSGEETARVFNSHRKSWLGERGIHVWHPDNGYQKTKILNQAIRQLQNENWVIFTDTDVILHPRFVADHRTMQGKQNLFMGRRTEGSAQFSNWLRRNADVMYSPEFYFRIFMDGLFGQTENYRRVFRIETPWLQQLLKMDRVLDLLGSNFSIDRQLLESVNGFNEALNSYWGEDGDLFIRCRNAGAKIMGLKNYAVQVHLWHTRREPNPEAVKWYESALHSKEHYVRCDKGLN